jgi:hypothetical protein
MKHDKINPKNSLFKLRIDQIALDKLESLCIINSITKSEMVRYLINCRFNDDIINNGQNNGLSNTLKEHCE